MINSFGKIFYLILILGSVSFAQKLSFIEYNVEDNLPQSTVTSIVQDKDGYIWFGTLDGISKFDGLNFTNYSTEEGLNEKTVRAVYPDREGRIWIATRKGLSILENDTIINYDSLTGIQEEYTCAAIAGNAAGEIYIGTLGFGLIKYHNGKFVRYTTDDGLVDNDVYSIFLDEYGNPWIGTWAGISFLDGDSFVNFPAGENGLPDAPVRAVYLSRDSVLWAGTAGSGLAKMLPDGSFDLITTQQGLIADRIYSIEEDDYQNLWIGTSQGVSKYDGSGFFNISTDNGLSAQIVLCIHRDREKNLWFGLFDGGINKLRSEKFVSYDKFTGLLSDQAYAIGEDNDGNVWVGTDAGLSEIKKDEVVNFTVKDGLSDEHVLAIQKDDEGTLWFGTLKGVTAYREGRFIPYTAANGFTDDAVGAVLQDSEGRLWFGTDNEGIYLYDGSGFTNYNKDDGLIGNHIVSICEDQSGFIWFASETEGLCYYDGSLFIPVEEMNDIFAEARIYDIASDNEDRIWIATQNAGFFIRTGKNDYEQYTTKDGLSNNVCYFCVHDPESDFTYIGTNFGLNRFDGESFKTYTSKAGLISNEFNRGAGFLDSKGLLWFGTIKGLVRYNPDLDKPNLIPPPVYITRFRIFERDTVYNEFLSLGYTENYLKFDFQGISLTSPEEILYKFKLEGVDADWQVSSQTTIQYTSLDDGEYRFEVKARNNDGIWSLNPAVVQFEILPPFWETWWFRVIVISFLLAAGYTAYLVRTYQLKQRNIELERLVNERTKELAAEKDKSDGLLHNILPALTVKELKEYGVAEPREYLSATILFTDFKGFTSISSGLHPQELVYELNDIFMYFDGVVEKYGLEKLKTIGDAYMIAGGLPEESDDHAERCVLAGLELQEYLCERNKNRNLKWQMRIGLHSGTVVAGVVGKRKFTYDIWGDSVNVASRIESAGVPFRVNISGSTYELIRDKFDCEYRGKVMAKGKGEIDMYFVAGVKKETLQKYPFAEISEIILID